MGWWPSVLLLLLILCLLFLNFHIKHHGEPPISYWVIEEKYFTWDWLTSSSTFYGAETWIATALWSLFGGGPEGGEEKYSQWENLGQCTWFFFFFPPEERERARYTDRADGQCLTNRLYGLKFRNIIRQLITKRPGKGGMHMWMDWMSRVWIYLCLMGFQRGISSEDKHNNQVDEMVHSVCQSAFCFIHPCSCPIDSWTTWPWWQDEGSMGV